MASRESSRGIWKHARSFPLLRVPWSSVWLDGEKTALPPKLRSTVVLKDVYGLSHEAIAEDLGISVAAAKVRLHRGRKRLRDVLFEEGGRSAHAV